MDYLKVFGNKIDKGFVISMKMAKFIHLFSTFKINPDEKQGHRVRKAGCTNL
jgi:hypothetical protein